MADFADGKIEAYFGPPELGAPDDLEQVIVDFIAGAEQSLDIAVQELDSIPIAEAILDARWRGVAVDALPRAGLPAARSCRSNADAAEAEEPTRRRSRRCGASSGGATRTDLARERWRAIAGS